MSEIGVAEIHVLVDVGKIDWAFFGGWWRLRQRSAAEDTRESDIAEIAG